MSYNPNQPKSDYFTPNVPPQTETTQRLAGGGYGQGPFFYSLGVQSTVPFVSLEGGGYTQKVFSWGEMIKVDEGQQVTVKNASYHQGDIQIISGHDYAAIPQRITVPVIVTVVGGPGGGVTPAYPADTRRCRKAYLHSQGITGGAVGAGILVTMRGRQDRHSFNSLQDPGLPNGYNQLITIPPGTAFGQLPMGFGLGLIPNSPMALLDKTDFIITFDQVPPALTTSIFMYSLEY